MNLASVTPLIIVNSLGNPPGCFEVTEIRTKACFDIAVVKTSFPFKHIVARGSVKTTCAKELASKEKDTSIASLS
jgi:hypothetical protein